jgi:hypothetical protein
MELEVQAPPLTRRIFEPSAVHSTLSPELILTRSRSSCSALPFVNVKIHADPIQKGSIVRQECLDATEKQAVCFSVTNSKTDFARAARA